MIVKVYKFREDCLNKLVYFCAELFGIPVNTHGDELKFKKMSPIVAPLPKLGVKGPC